MSQHRAFWLRQLHTWHWISAALSLSGMLLFAITGLTLNHVASIPASLHEYELEQDLPPDLLKQLNEWPLETNEPLPPAIAAWIQDLFKLDLHRSPTDTTEDEIYIDLPRPGGDRSLLIDRFSGTAIYQERSRGWVAFLNDLHKGRNTGAVWFWFIDLVAASCVVFTLTGLALLAMHSRGRPSTWPITGLSLVLPLLVLLLFIHG